MILSLDIESDATGLERVFALHNDYNLRPVRYQNTQNLKKYADEVTKSENAFGYHNKN